MPGFNGTGPRTEGAMTGRGRGYCISYVPSTGLCTGHNRGAFRGGRCKRQNSSSYRLGEVASLAAEAVYVPTVRGEEELVFFKEQVISLEKALDLAKKRIEKLDNKK